MSLCFNFERICCGVSIQGAMYAALFHYIIHGLFIVAFVFSNNSYPPFYWVDYLFGGAGAALLFLSIVTIFIVNAERLFALRAVFATLIMVIVILTVVSTILYAVQRWNDVITTAITRALRKPVERDFPDYFWYTMVITACVICLVLLFHLIYVGIYMYRKTFPQVQEIISTPVMVVPAQRRPVPPPEYYYTNKSKPYPVQG